MSSSFPLFSLFQVIVIRQGPTIDRSQIMDMIEFVAETLEQVNFATGLLIALSLA